MKKVWSDSCIRIISEPGDATRYDYVVYSTPGDLENFSIAPVGSTFNYPQKLNYWDALAYLKDPSIQLQSCFNANPHTIREVCRTIVAIKEGKISEVMV